MSNITYNPFSLQDKTILVTGASSGIGKAIAIECSKMGATVIITGRDKDRLNQTFNSLINTGSNLQIVADLSSDEGIETIVKQLPTLDGVVHAAGFIDPVPFNFISRERLQSILSVNFVSCTLLSQRIAKLKKINKDSSIVFISSVSGVMCSTYGNSLYAATKGAVNGIAKGMALDLSPRGIRVNTVIPGMIQTGILDDGVITDEQIEIDKKRYPLKRYGKPEEVAYAVIYLLSDASKWVTGSNLLIDGGYTLL